MMIRSRVINSETGGEAIDEGDDAEALTIVDVVGAEEEAESTAAGNAAQVAEA